MSNETRGEYTRGGPRNRVRMLVYPMSDTPTHERRAYTSRFKENRKRSNLLWTMSRESNGHPRQDLSDCWLTVNLTAGLIREIFYETRDVSVETLKLSVNCLPNRLWEL